MSIPPAADEPLGAGGSGNTGSLPPKRCGNCEFGGLNPQDLKVVECQGLPPQIAVVGMSPQGPAITLLYPNLPRSRKGCALWAKQEGSSLLVKG